MSDMRKSDNPPRHQPLPDCMMPDGTEPCAGFRYEADRRCAEMAESARQRTTIEDLKKCLYDDRAEIDRLQEAKRRALAIADERAKEAERLRAAITAARQRLNESGTGQMGLLDTIHETHAILLAARAALPAPEDSK